MMKQIIIGITIIIFFLISCEKDPLMVNNTNRILGKWNVITDSSFAGVGAGNHAVSYAGQPGDYFDFRADGFVYTKESSVFDTLNYSLTSGTTIIISSFGVIINGVPDTCQITNPSGNSILINAPAIITPGGVFGRKVYLKR